MKDPRCMFVTNILMTVYLGSLTYYLFYHFFQYEFLNLTDGDAAAREDHNSLYLLSMEYFRQKDAKEQLVNMKIFLILHNVLLILVLRLLMSRPKAPWSTISNGL